ncbi:MAG TPA: hypothetical protein PK610_07515, partial [Flavobacteriales bacterium]|nr:hypothetical protein [Flavobacteriales bacterium]
MKKHLLLLLVSLLFGGIHAIGQTYTMGTAPAGNNATINTCSGTFFDSGGSGGAYGNSQNFVVTICPSTPGQMIQLNITSFNTEANFDYLTLFSGTGTGGPILVGPVSGTAMPNPSTVVSQAANGCVTIRFTSDGSVTAAGFSIGISCVTGPTCTDGIQNGQEAGVDCGGCSTCPPCPGSGITNATVTAASNIINLPCGGGNVNLSAVGNSTTVQLGSNFNSGTPGPGWSVSPAGQFNNPCGNGPAGTGAH